jgi:hypothetical protein
MRDHRAVSTLMSFAVAYIGIAGLFLTRLGAQTVRIEVYPLQELNGMGNYEHDQQSGATRSVCHDQRHLPRSSCWPNTPASTRRGLR